MENPFDPISNWLDRNRMTPSEKQSMRTSLVHYATTHPVKSGLMSPYGFRAAFAIVATLVLVLGGSLGVTQAASRSLPNSSLYPIKLWIEEFRASQQKTPEAVIAYATGRINARFGEAAELAARHELNSETSAIIAGGLNHSEEMIKSAANDISQTDPELALAATTSVENVYSSNGKILFAIGQNTNQDLQTFILGTQISTESLALARTHFEQIVAKKPNVDTKSAALLALKSAEDSLAALPADDAAENSATVAMVAASTLVQDDAKEGPSPAAAKMMIAASVVQAPAAPVVKSKSETVSGLIENAKAKMDAGLYSEALVILKKAQQIIDEETLTKNLETTYNVKTSPAKEKPADVPASDQAVRPAMSSEPNSQPAVSDQAVPAKQQ